jgi:hypothetical protein
MRCTIGRPMQSREIGAGGKARTSRQSTVIYFGSRKRARFDAQGLLVSSECFAGRSRAGCRWCSPPLEQVRFSNRRHAERWGRRKVAALPINNPRHILQTLDSYLEKETRIVLFGRAALTLGFGDFGRRFGTTQDVDAILPTVEMARIESDTQFWEAIDNTNKRLEPSGLYVSHLFTDRQVALTVDWLDKTVKIPSDEYQFLRLLRPSSLDLILTKMMRNDREDLGDIRFILEQENISPSSLESAFRSARELEVPELQAIFLKMQPVVHDIALAIDGNRSSGGISGPSSYPLDPDWWSKLTNEMPQKRSLEKDRGLSL